MQNRKGAARWRRRLPVHAAVCLFTFRDPKIAAARCRCKQYDVGQRKAPRILGTNKNL